MRRVNIGCGSTPTEGWDNYDNSLSIRLSTHLTLAKMLHKLKLIDDSQFKYILYCRKNTIRWADATKSIPLPNNSVEVLYSSHMLEHLDRQEAVDFLKEAKRVIVQGGIIRLAVPDLERQIRKYLDEGNANLFLESTLMCVSRPRALSERLRMLFVGTRHHQWMYDSRSLCTLLTNSGYVNPKSFAAGDTFISDPNPLDLCERADESLYVEAIKP